MIPTFPRIALFAALAIAGPASAQEPLDAYVASFSALGPVAVRATATIERKLESGEWVSGKGSYDYWDDGGQRYRVICRTDPELGLAHDSDASYDGRQGRLRLNDSMAVTSQYDKVTAEVLLNPILLPVAFTRPRLPDCGQLCRFNLKDVTLGDQSIARSAEPSASDEIVYTIERDSIGPLQPREVFVVRFRELAPGRWLPVESRHQSGELSAVTTFSDYSSFGAFDYPRRLVTSTSDSSGAAARVDYQILAVNKPEGDEIYRVPPMARMWDVDAGTLVYTTEER